MTTPTTIKLSAIRTADNVRGELSNIDELAASIAANGLLQPLVVESDPEQASGVVLVAGHRRLAALKALKFETVDVVYVDAGKRHVLQLVENLQRDDLSPMEEARGLATIVDELGTQTAAAKATGKSKGHISKRLALLRLPEDVQASIDAGVVTLEQAAELVKIDDPKRQSQLVETIDSSLAPGTIAAHIESAVRDAERERANVKAAADENARLEGKAVRVGARQWAPVHAVPSSWRTLEGPRGLPVDYDEHRKEPCHAASIGRRSAWDKEPSTEEWCADPGRHTPEGESSLKLPTATEEEVAEAEAKAQRRADAEAAEAALAEWRAKRDAELELVASKFSDRNQAQRALAIGVLWQADLPEVVAALTAAGIELPDAPEGVKSWEPEYQAWANRIDVYAAGHDEDGNELSASKLYRAALVILGAWAINSWETVPARYALANLLGITDLDKRPTA